jgi:hypothetical protein
VRKIFTDANAFGLSNGDIITITLLNKVGQELTTTYKNQLISYKKSIEIINNKLEGVTEMIEPIKSNVAKWVVLEDGYLITTNFSVIDESMASETGIKLAEKLRTKLKGGNPIYKYSTEDAKEFNIFRNRIEYILILLYGLKIQPSEKFREWIANFSEYQRFIVNDIEASAAQIQGVIRNKDKRREFFTPSSFHRGQANLVSALNERDIA